MTMPKIMTDNKNRSNMILMTFYSYPSMAGLSAESGAAMIAAYLELLTEFSDEILETATLKIRRSPERYPPSAGQVYNACQHEHRLKTDDQYRIKCRSGSYDNYGVSKLVGTKVAAI